MTSSREKILGRIRAGVGADQRSAADHEILRERLASRSRGVLPSRSDISPSALVDLFFEKAMGQGCSAVRVSSEADVVTATTNYLREHNLPSRIALSSSDKVTALPWTEASGLECRQGAAKADDVTSVTPVASAVAETGTMVTTSGPETPTTLNFVPENHILVVRESDLVKHYEDAWDKIREAGAMPRTVNWLTGPSRSADIGQTMYMGAHGPRRQHIIFIEGA